LKTLEILYGAEIGLIEIPGARAIFHLTAPLSLMAIEVIFACPNTLELRFCYLSYRFFPESVTVTTIFLFLYCSENDPERGMLPLFKTILLIEPLMLELTFDVK
jgi:hypothetical protein